MFFERSIMLKISEKIAYERNTSIDCTRWEIFMQQLVFGSG